MGAAVGFQGGAGEILRQASVALGGRTVTLFELSEDIVLVPRLSSGGQFDDAPNKGDLDSTLRRWNIPLRPGARWVACRRPEGPWVIAPVRSQPPAPPPTGVERRSPDRLTLELAGLCVGLTDRRGAGHTAASPAGPALPDALHQLLNLPAVIAHETGNPLTAARAGLQLAMQTVGQMPGVEEERRLELLEELGDVAEALERALDFLRAVGDRARGTGSGRVRFDLVRAARSCVALEGRLLRHAGVPIQFVTALDAVFVDGDPNLFYEMLLNLVRNAAEASAERRSVVRVTLDRADDEVTLSVADQGTGIPPHLVDRIFEAGFTTKSYGKGSGTGLAVVRQIVQNAFLGHVGVESVPGRGTTLTVRFPATRQRGEISSR